MSENAQSNGDKEALERTRAVKQAHEAELMGRANVVGVGVGLIRRGGAPTGQVGIIVMVSRKRPARELAAKDLIPKQLEGVPVDVQEVGEIWAQ